MTWHAVYRISDGQLASVGEVIADPLPAGLASVEIYEPDFATHEWDSASLGFVPKQVNTVSICDAFDFYRAFTPAERIGIRMLAKTDPIAEDFVHTLNNAISSGSRIFSSDPDLFAAMAYLAMTPSDGPVLSDARRDAILAVLT